MKLDKVYIAAQKAANELGEDMSIFKIGWEDYEYMTFDGSDVEHNMFVEKISPEKKK